LKATKKCPNCGFENPDSANVCQCGHDFSEGEVSNSRVDSNVQVDIEEVPRPKGDKKTLFIALGILLIVFGALSYWILPIIGGVLLLGKAFRKAQVMGWNEGQEYRFLKAPGKIVEKIVLINLFIFLVTLFFSGPLTGYFALTPNQLFKGYIWQLLTYFFLHGSFFDFLPSAVFLWQLGSDVEEKKGGRFFLIFYIMCGVGGGLSYTLLRPFGEFAVIGSDGCISGIIVAYLFLFPNRYIFHRWIKFKFICPLLLLGGLSPLLLLGELSPSLSLGGGVFLWMGGMLTGAILMRYVSDRGWQMICQQITLISVVRNKILGKQKTSAPAASIEPMFVSESWILRFGFHTPTAPLQPSWIWGLRIVTLASLLALWASIYGFAASDPDDIAFILPALIMATPYIVILTFLRKNPPQANTLAMAVGIGSVAVFYAIWVGSVSLGATHAALVVTATKTFYSLRKTRIESLRQQWPSDTSKLIVRSVVYAFLFCWLAFSAYLSLFQLLIELGRSL